MKDSKIASSQTAKSPDSKPTLRMELRTPTGLSYSGTIKRLRAEDLDGWFGIAPGRPDFISVLPPGVLVFEDEQGEGYVASAGGALSLTEGVCRLALRSAVVARNSRSVAEALEEQRDSAQQHIRSDQQTLGVLLDEAMRRVGEPGPH